MAVCNRQTAVTGWHKGLYYIDTSYNMYVDTSPSPWLITWDQSNFYWNIKVWLFDGRTDLKIWWIKQRYLLFPCWGSQNECDIMGHTWYWMKKQQQRLHLNSFTGLTCCLCICLIMSLQDLLLMIILVLSQKIENIYVQRGYVMNSHDNF